MTDLRTSEGAGFRFGAVVFIALLLAQIAVYHECFLVKPAGDDFGPPLTEIARGEREGPLVFFTDSDQDCYRPLQSTTMWLVGRKAGTQMLTAIHLLHFASMAVYGFACLLWSRQLGLRRVGVVVAGFVTFFHPAFGGVLGGIDNWSGVVAHALMWLGALSVIRWRDKFPLAVGVALLFLVVGSLFKEYAFGLVPLATLTALVFSPQKPIRRAIVTAIVLGGFMALSLIGRQFFGGLEDPNVRMPLHSPIYMIPRIARNAALLAGATLFTGNTIWVNLSQSAWALKWVGVNVASLIAVVSLGLVMLLRSPAPSQLGATPTALRPRDYTSGRWIVFLLLSFAAASFPANLVPYRVSEVYVTGLILPLSLLCGLAAEGIARGARWIRVLALALAIAHLVVACMAITAKVEGLRNAGETSAQLLDQVVELLPDVSQGQTVAFVFVNAELKGLPSYSVYLLPADSSIGTPWALDYHWPGRDLRVETIYVDGIEEVEADAYDAVVRWDQANERFVRLK